MIIQCKQCRTKFRFDDAQMDSDGVWMRCSRCQHVFFQENPLKTSSSAVAPQTPSSFSAEHPPAEKTERLSFEAAGPAPAATRPDEDVASFLQHVMTPEKTAGDEWESAPEPTKRAGMSLTDIEFSPESENLDAADEPEELPEEAPAPPVRKKSRRWMIALWAILVIIVIPVIVYLFVFPDLGDRYVEIARKVVGVPQQADSQPVTGQIKLQDIRQRVIHNYILGNIRIVEGTAVNSADYSIARVMIKAEMLDAYGVVLDKRVSYAGNILTDDELTNMSEEEILRKLSLPEGRDNSNERVIPNGQIPFMIVFKQAPAGSIKTTVIVYGAERLL